MGKNKDTIFALATPSGKSAIATIRVSGAKSHEILKKISSKFHKIPNIAKLTNIINEKKEIIDQTITTIYKSPKSYTGEDMVEISTHGSSTVINKTITVLSEFENCRMAEPGEFTRRAFENNKLDLAQVEAISDIVNSETEAQRKQAIQQLSGQFSKKIQNWSDKIIKILANVEASIDFSDEDLPNNLIKICKEQIENTIIDIKKYLDDGNIGEKIRTGFYIAILGKPNVGKSTFLNYIAKRDAAIVTSEPGTTRDAIEIFVEYDGLPIKIIDTAGIREAKNTAEKLGVQKSLEISKISDINLVIIDNVSDIDYFSGYKNKIYIQSKKDINKKINSNKKIYYISAKNGDGIKELFKVILNKLKYNKNLEEPGVSRERHRNILINTIKYLENSLDYKNTDLFAEDIRLAFNEIIKIYGKKDVEDILDIIFSDFCIGK